MCTLVHAYLVHTCLPAHMLTYPKPGAHELPKAVKEHQTQHARPSRCSSPSHVLNFYLIRQEAIYLKV